MATWTRRTLIGFGAAIVAALMSVPALTVRASAAGAVSSPNVVRQTNEVRAKNGLAGLHLDPLLTRAAQSKAEDMAARGYFAHQAPDGRMPWDWIEGAGYEYLAAAENLAVGYPTDDDLIQAWMESEGHRHNLLNQKYTDIGIGIAHGRYKGQETVFVVQMFGKPRIVPARAVLPAVTLALGPQRLAAVPLAAIDLAFDPVLLAGTPLESAVLPIDPTPQSAVLLSALDSSAAPALLAAWPDGVDEPPPLDAFVIAFDLALPPSMVLDAREIPFGESRLPRGVPRARRLTSVLRSLH